MMQPPWHQFQHQARINWYPGHMVKALRSIKSRMAQDEIGALLEVRDMRAPLSCINARFEHFLQDQAKPARGLVFKNAWGEVVGRKVTRPRRMILYNKCDLVGGIKATASWQRYLVQYHRQKLRCNDSIYFTHTQAQDQACIGAEQVLFDTVRWWVDHHRPRLLATPSKPYPPLNILVMGLPNTGKSSIINALRVEGMGMGAHGSRKIAPTGKEPGFTRSVSSKIKLVDTETIRDTRVGHIDNDVGGQKDTNIMRYLKREQVRLKVFIMDSPGVLAPNFSDTEVAVRLSLIHCVPNDVSGLRGADVGLLSEYLWWKMVKVWGMSNAYLRRQGIVATETPDDPSCAWLLQQLARKRIAHSNPLSSHQLAVEAQHFVKSWQDGSLYMQTLKLPRNQWPQMILDDQIHL
jgi:ribosome biogenesis GTPase A